MLIGSFIHARTSEAATYYVATNGNDSNPGTQTQPFRSLTKGVNALKAGDTLYLRAGVYSSIDASTIPSGTSWTNAITIASYPGEKATLTPYNSQAQVLYFWSGNHHIILDGLILDGTGAIQDGLKIGEQSHHIRFINGEIKNAGQNSVLVTPGPGGGWNEFINCKIHDGGGRGPHANGTPGFEHGFYVGADNGLIDNCDIYNHRFGYGLHFYGGTGANWIVRNSGIWNSLEAGILLQDATDTLVYNNAIWGNKSGIWARNNGMKILNNAVYGNLGNFVPGIWIQHDGSGDSPRHGAGITVANNIVVNNNSSFGSGGIYVGADVPGAIVRNNLLSNNSPNNFEDAGSGTMLSGNLIGNQYNPKFVNAATNDFHLQLGSHAIDAGVTVSEVTTDHDGKPRSKGVAPDIGAYEFQTTPVVSLPPTNLQIIK